MVGVGVVVVGGGGGGNIILQPTIFIAAFLTVFYTCRDTHV